MTMITFPSRTRRYLRRFIKLGRNIPISFVVSLVRCFRMMIIRDCLLSKLMSGLERYPIRP